MLLSALSEPASINDALADEDCVLLACRVLQINVTEIALIGRGDRQAEVPAGA